MNYTDVSLMENNNKPIINNKIDFLIQEINVLFDTSPEEVLGSPLFGTNFEKFIWDLNASNIEISTYVLRAIQNKTISGNDFDIDVTTDIIHGTQNDIILVKIDIHDPETGYTYDLIYKII